MQSGVTTQVTTGNNRVELSSAGSGRAWWVLGVYSMYDLHYLVTYVERIRMAMGLARFSGLRCRTTRRAHTHSHTPQPHAVSRLASRVTHVIHEKLYTSSIGHWPYSIA